MSLTRRELCIVYHNLKSQYRRKERDKDICKGIDVLCEALFRYIDGQSYDARDIEKIIINKD